MVMHIQMQTNSHIHNVYIYLHTDLVYANMHSHKLMHICVYVNAYSLTLMHSIRIHIRTIMQKCKFFLTQLLLYIIFRYIDIQTHIYSAHLHLHIRTHKHACIHRYIHTQTHTNNMHARAHTRILTHTH